MCCFSRCLTPEFLPSWADRRVGIQLVPPEPEFSRLPNSPKRSLGNGHLRDQDAQRSFRPPREDISFPATFLFCSFRHLSHEALPRNNTAFTLSFRLFSGRKVRRTLVTFPYIGLIWIQPVLGPAFSMTAEEAEHSHDNMPRYYSTQPIIQSCSS